MPLSLALCSSETPVYGALGAVCSFLSVFPSVTHHHHHHHHHHPHCDIQCELKNPKPDFFLKVFPKRLGIFIPNFTCLYRLYLRWTANFYSIICNFDQVTPYYARPPLYAQNVHHRLKHAARSHLIWHNFVTVGDNWI